MASGAGVPHWKCCGVLWWCPAYRPVVGIDWIRMENTAELKYSNICLRSKHLGFHEMSFLNQVTSNHDLENNQELLVLSMGLRR